MFVLIRGAGDLASGIALRLWHSGYGVAMTDLPCPTAIRRTVAFSEALRSGTAQVEDVTAWKAESAAEVRNLLSRHLLPVLADPSCSCRDALRPDALVDAILAKRNLGTRITDAPVVVCAGPGFTAGTDCHAVVETMRGHTLGRALYAGSALPNTSVPGLIGGFAGERVLRAPADGVFRGVRRIGDLVRAGDIIGYVTRGAKDAGETGGAGDVVNISDARGSDTAGDCPMPATLDGVLRGLLADGVAVHAGMKAGDVDPRGNVSSCFTVSDKALAVGGGVLEALLHFGVLPGQKSGQVL